MTIEELQTKLVKAEAEVEAWKKKCVDYAQQNSQHIGNQLELEKHKKIVLVIGHILADRKLEAIQQIIEPMPVLFNLEVKFADDRSQLAAMDEMLETVKKQVILALDTVRIHRTDEQKLAEVERKLDKD